MILSGVGSILGNERALVLKMFYAVGDRIDLGNRSDIGVRDRSIENFGDIGTVEIEEVKGDKAKHEGNTQDTRGAPP
jgi:hypothetical protein